MKVLMIILLVANIVATSIVIIKITKIEKCLDKVRFTFISGSDKANLELKKLKEDIIKEIRTQIYGLVFTGIKVK